MVWFRLDGRLTSASTATCTLQLPVCPGPLIATTETRRSNQHTDTTFVTWPKHLPLFTLCIFINLWHSLENSSRMAFLAVTSLQLRLLHSFNHKESYLHKRLQKRTHWRCIWLQKTTAKLLMRCYGSWMWEFLRARSRSTEGHMRVTCDNMARFPAHRSSVY